MKYIVFYLQFIISLEGPGMFFSSAAVIRRLRRYTARAILKPIGLNYNRRTSRVEVMAETFLV